MSNTKRFVGFKVTDRLYCVWDTEKGCPIEVGRAATYVCSSRAHAMAWAFYANRKDDATNWQEGSPEPEQLSLSATFDLVIAMIQVNDYNRCDIPRILERLKAKVIEWEANEFARKVVNEIYAGVTD